VRPARLLRRLIAGSLQNVRFADTPRLVEALGFDCIQTSGSDRIYVHPEIHELLNLQNVKGEAKPYQLRRLLRLAERYNLKVEDER
jgi:predicted RNA binding protein YcfA (HicA-like mRNA interferase family)